MGYNWTAIEQVHMEWETKEAFDEALWENKEDT